MRSPKMKIECHGKSLTLSEWSRELGVNRVVLWLRLYRYKVPIEKALSKEKCSRTQKGRVITWGEKISKSLKGKKRKPLSDDHKRKIGEAHKAEKHWRWIEDRTKLKTSRLQAYDRRYREWMKQVKKRDAWKCKISNQDCSGRLEAHHILPWSQHPELRYEVNNGISLCHYHHPRKRKEEQRLAPVFKKMVLRPSYELAHN